MSKEILDGDEVKLEDIGIDPKSTINIEQVGDKNKTSKLTKIFMSAALIVGVTLATTNPMNNQTISDSYAAVESVTQEVTQAFSDHGSQYMKKAEYLANEALSFANNKFETLTQKAEVSDSKINKSQTKVSESKSTNNESKSTNNESKSTNNESKSTNNLEKKNLEKPKISINKKAVDKVMTENERATLEQEKLVAQLLEEDASHENDHGFFGEDTTPDQENNGKKTSVVDNLETEKPDDYVLGLNL